MDFKLLKIPKSKRNTVTRQAARDLAKKMSLEPKLIRKLKLFLNKIGKDSKKHYIATSTMLPLTPYRNELTKILFDHYLRVYNNFSYSMRKSSKTYKHYLLKHEIKKDNNVEYTISLDTTHTTTASVNIDDNVNEKIKEKSIQDSLERADKQSGFIMQTTQKQLEESYFQAESQSGEFGSELSTEQIASDATDMYTEKSKSRPNEIAVTETQAVAEKAKYEEANAVAYTLSSDTTGAIETAPAEFYNPLEGEDLTDLKGYTIKYWVTMSDNLVREAHQAAEGQVQFADEPFTVMGEELMMPGDTSMGASAANICNCRCTAVYEYIE